MRTTTRYALAAALATTLMGGTALAADLGGNCCADLEERVAELEATTVRKGNRKVSVTLSGFVSHNVMWWDDGTQSDIYVGDGGNYGSRFRFVGTAKINPQVSVGFLYEFGANTNAIGAMNQGNFGDDLGQSGGASCPQGGNSPGCVGIRDTTVWMRHAQLGMIKIGHGSTATDNLTLIDLGGTTGGATSDVALYPGAMVLRSNAGILDTLTWTSAIRGHQSWDTDRQNHVLYETPTLHGFNIQVAAAEDNYWDVALRYAGEFNGIRIASGIGYLENSEFNQPVNATSLVSGSGTVVCANLCNVKVNDLKGSASVLHVPTGLFVTTAYGRREIEGSQSPAAGTAYLGPDLKFWYLSGGVARNFFGVGNTVLFGEYSESKGGLEQTTFLAATAAASAAYNNNTVTRSSSEVTHWGLGVTQHIDAAAMEVFATYKNYSLDANGFLGTNVTLNRDAVGVHDVSVFVIGTRISF